MIFEDHRKKTTISAQCMMTIFTDIEQFIFEIEIAISLGWLKFYGVELSLYYCLSGGEVL
ncbi:hypothetical protein BCS89_04700 [Vibrio splendidus]|nr:hypothetical protein BCT03_06785 [Vibrio splendidus]PMO95653.1 hypothetical protein BCS97_14290 [Vibrio splendidus]PMP33201.1 hypothetical protein BCS88_01570 [Vibrio splendidus]PMP34873.1 hypothetical protein BCS89_04700 [Vibrio splendidus]PMP38421.1 hypothetical protein BCS87_12465 [Vibrio splendidus]